MNTYRLIALALLFAGTTPCAAERFEYRRGIAGDTLTIEAPTKGANGSVAFEGDETAPAVFCEADSPYICVFSKRFTFAVPKDLTASSDNWTVKGVTFTRLRAGVTVSLFGRERRELSVIATPTDAFVASRQAKQPLLTLYSAEYGVVGFGFDSGGAATAFWSTGEKGFGANRRESARAFHFPFDATTYERMSTRPRNKSNHYLRLTRYSARFDSEVPAAFTEPLRPAACTSATRSPALRAAGQTLHPGGGRTVAIYTKPDAAAGTQAAVFVILHELGHTQGFDDYSSNRFAWGHM